MRSGVIRMLSIFTESAVTFQVMAAQILGVLNENAGTIQAISTIVLVAITAWYAVNTHKLTAITRKQVDTQLRAEQLKRSEAFIRVGRIARELLYDVDRVYRRPIPETVTKMKSAAWRGLRDDLQLDASEIGGIIQKQADTAVNALFEWDMCVYRSPNNRETQKKAEEQLAIARDALQMIVSLTDSDVRS